MFAIFDSLRMLEWIAVGSVVSVMLGGYLTLVVLLIWQIMFRGRSKWFWLAGAIALALSGGLLGFAGLVSTSIT